MKPMLDLWDGLWSVWSRVRPKKHIVAVLAACFLLYTIYDAARFMRMSETTEGEVVQTGKYRGRRKSFGARRYRIIRFRTDQSATIHVTFDDITLFGPTPLGTRIPLRYNPTNPHEAQVDSWVNWPGIKSVVGVIYIAFSIVALVAGVILIIWIRSYKVFR
ncbi:MAG: DUF3592 domain-containing protein [Armatimonadota bacterium]|nr:DUF3592 domain-containing protein [Armatimonadota bacterium]